MKNHPCPLAGYKYCIGKDCKLFSYTVDRFGKITSFCGFNGEIIEDKNDADK